MQKIVGVKFKPNGKIYYFNPNNIEFKENEEVVCDTNYGLEFGVVAIASGEIDDKELREPLRNIVRKATDKDKENVKKIKQKANEAFEEANKHIKELKLDMDLIDVQYLFDGSKCVFTFTSENRVDFRELIKLLASSLHTRIELRQVGIRDEAKAVGGIGPCGREVCCAKFLRDFEKVNIKMAKNQGLSLNPSNINGLCNRLMCCLSYENEHYAETLAIMPKLNSKVQTEDGEGTVVYNNILKKICSVKFVLPDETYKFADYPLEKIKF